MSETSRPQVDEVPPPPLTVAPIGEPMKIRPLAATPARNMPLRTGQRTRAINTPVGYVVRAVVPLQPPQRMSEVALMPTLYTAVRRHLHPTAAPNSPLPLSIHPTDIRCKVRSARRANLILFVVDASGSMAARQRMKAVKGAIFSLLLDAYQKRDSVGLIAFRGAEASLLLPPTNSVNLAQRHLAALPTGGRTPLAQGLRLAHQLLHQQMRRTDALLPLMVLLSDGRANVGQHQPPLADALLAAAQIAQRGWSALVIDCESGYPRLGLAAQIGQALAGETIQLAALSAGSVTQAVRQKLNLKGSKG